MISHDFSKIHLDSEANYWRVNDLQLRLYEAEPDLVRVPCKPRRAFSGLPLSSSESPHSVLVSEPKASFGARVWGVSTALGSQEGTKAGASQKDGTRAACPNLRSSLGCQGIPSNFMAIPIGNPSNSSVFLLRLGGQARHLPARRGVQGNLELEPRRVRMRMAGKTWKNQAEHRLKGGRFS